MKMMNIKAACGVMFLFVLAVIPRSAQSSEVYACTSKSGNVRIVSDLTQCKQSEHPVTWNSAGAQGPVGPTGPAGPAGPGMSFSRYLLGQVSGLAPAAEFDVHANCTGQDMPIGGGFDIGAVGLNETKDVQVWTSSPDGNGWRCRGKVLSQTESSSITCYVSCLHIE